jgi:hypothetical protein
MIDTRVYYVLHDAAGTIAATGFCERTALKARTDALASGYTLLVTDLTTWQNVRSSPAAFEVAGGVITPRQMPRAVSGSAAP